MDINVDPNMTKEQAKQELLKINAFCAMKERIGSEYTFEEVIEIKSKQIELEKIYGGRDWL